MTLASLDAGDVREVMACFSGLLEDHREVVNRLNVYPVPDGDTGTNMSLTVAAVVSELAGKAKDAPMAEVCHAVAHGSLMGARGNSGVILSQLLRGIAEALRGGEACDLVALREALRHADEMARQAVVRPVEGTILTISRAAATGAAEGDGDLAGVVRAARAAARSALERTPEMLPVLKQAGVVDAGGAGLCLLYDALCHVVAGDALPVAPPVERVHLHVPEPEAVHGGDVGSLRYEVMYFLEARDDAIPAFREVWAGIGDSIVVVGGDGLFNCHIHTDDVGAAIEAALDAGRPRHIRVTDLAEQVIEERWVREGAFEHSGSVEPGPAPRTGVVAVVQGEGIGRIFRSLGVRVLVQGGQSMNPSTQDLLDAVRATGSEQVLLLPNNKNIVPVANQAAALADAPVTVVPTRSIVEGFAALLAYDPDAPAEANGPAMTSSSSHVVAAEVTRAVRDAATDAGEVREGDWIGLTDDRIVSVAESIAVASCALLAQVVRPEHELVTVIEGDGATPANTRRIAQWLAEERPAVSVEVHHGGQPLYPYLFGIE